MMKDTYKILAITTDRTRYDFLHGPINSLYDLLLPTLHSADITETFLAKSLKDSQLYAIRLIDKNFFKDDLKNQLSLQSKFSDLAPRIHSQLVTGDSYAIVLELMNGCSLSDQLNILKRLPEYKLREVALFLVDALDKLSSKQIVHNGIRPSQILINVGPKGTTYKLSGFENAQSLSNLRPFESENTKCVSPEVKGGKAPSLASDIWSVGATLYKLATGNDYDPLLKIKNLDKEFGVPEDLRELIEGCLKENPNERIKLFDMKKMLLIHLEGSKDACTVVIMDVNDNFPEMIKVLHERAGIEKSKIRVQKGYYKPYIITKKIKTAYGYFCYCLRPNKDNPKDMDGKYIIRVVGSSELRQPEMKKRLVQELLVQSKMENSPYCNVMTDSFIWQGEGMQFEFCMVTEWCNGFNLDEYLKIRKQALRMNEMQLILWNIACALRDIHINNMTHRGIEPMNIFLKLEDDQIIDVLLSDFGLGNGVRNVAAPEVKNAKKGEYTSKVDVWSFGILMHKLLFNKTPYETKLNTIEGITSGKQLQYPQIDDNELYIDLMNKCLTLNSDYRYNINDVIGHEYFHMVVFVTKKKLAPYVDKKEELSNLGDEYYQFAKAKMKQPFMAKKIPVSTLDHSEGTKRLGREIAAMIRLRNSRNVIKLYDYFYHDNYLYLIMENISPFTLDYYINDKYKETDIQGRRWLIFEILKAIKDIHDHNFFHRGITQKTIILNYDKKTAKVNAVRLFEFEMAKTSTDPSIVYVDNEICLAPELAMSGEATKASDIWAFGMVIYFIIFGVSFLKSSENSSKLAWTGNIKIPKDAPDPDMIKIMRTCLNPKPTLRPPTDKLYEEVRHMVKK